MEIIQLTTIVVLLFTAILNFLRYRDILYPPVIQANVWLIVVTLYVLNQDFFHSVSNYLYLVVVNGVIMFSIGSYFATFRYNPEIKPIQIPQPVNRKQTIFLNVLFWLSILGLPFYVYKAYTIGLSGDTENYYMNLRYALSSDEKLENYGILVYLWGVSFVSVGLQMLSDYRYRKIKLPIAFVVAFIYAFFSTGRSAFFLLFAIIFGILAISRKNNALKLFVYSFVGGLFVFIAIGYLLEKGASAKADFSENILTMWDNLRIYLLSPLAAFDRFMQLDRVPGYGENLFRTIVAIFEKLGFEVQAVKLVKEFVFVPWPSNVYTIYQPYYTDFLEYGIVTIQFVFGYWHGLLYKKANMGNLFYVFLYAIFLYPLLIQFFHDQYFNLLSLWIQFIALSSFFFLLSDSKNKERQVLCQT